jgi:hypothetical protein
MGTLFLGCIIQENFSVSRTSFLQRICLFPKFSGNLDFFSEEERPGNFLKKKIAPTPRPPLHAPKKRKPDSLNSD